VTALVPHRALDLRRQLAAARALTLRARVGRLYAVVDAAERRAARRQREVQALRASAEILCQRSSRIGRAAGEAAPNDDAAVR